MITPNSKLLGTLARRTLYLLAASCGVWACSDPVSTPVRHLGARPDAAVVTLPEGTVTAGDMVWISIDLARPCWNQEASADVTVAWDASRFELHPTLAGGPTEAATTAAGGWARIHLSDRDGFGSGIRIPFIARAATEADGFRVEGFSVLCSGHGPNPIY